MPVTGHDPNETVVMPDLPDAVLGDQEGLSRSGSPSWGGVDLSAGDNADATGGVRDEDAGA